MQHVDGNALAGPLAEFFTFDVTIATARCKGCGTVAELARAMVYQSGPARELPSTCCIRCLRIARCGSTAHRAPAR